MRPNCNHLYLVREAKGALGPKRAGTCEDRTEIGVIQSQGKGPLEPSEAERGRKDPPLEPPEGS